VSSAGASDSGRLAGVGVGGGAELRGRDELVGDDGRVHVGGGNPLGGQQDRRDLRAGRRVGGEPVHQRGWRSLPGAQVDGNRGRGLGLQVDRLVDGAALIAGQDVLQGGQGGVLPGGREGLRPHAPVPQVADDRGGVRVVRDQRRVDVRVGAVLLLELRQGSRRVPGAGRVADV